MILGLSILRNGELKTRDMADNYIDKIKLRGLAVDIDDTLSNTMTDCVEKMMTQFGNPENLSVKEIVEKYRFVQDVPYWQNTETLEWMVTAINSNEVQGSLPLIEDANIVLRKISEKIIPIAVYLTARPELVVAGTREWLNKHGFPPAPLICRPNEIEHEGGNKWKAGVLQELYPKIVGIIDDNPKLFSYLPDSYAGTIFLYDHHDNFGRNNVIPCRNWLEVYKNIKNIYKNFK